MFIKICGVTTITDIDRFRSYHIDQFAIDQRPQNLNFTQIENTKHLLDYYPNIDLIFDSKYSYAYIATLDQLSSKNITVDFRGEDISPLIELNLKFTERYSDKSNLDLIKNRFGFSINHEDACNILSNKKHCESLNSLSRLELVIPWGSDINISLLDSFTFTHITFELDNSVMIGYQIPDFGKVINNISYISKLISGATNEDISN